MNSKTDLKAVIEKIRSGDQGAIKLLYKESFSYCASYVINNSGERNDARDVFQQAMIVLLEKLKDPSFVINYNVRSYLYAITKNLWLKELRKRSKTKPLEQRDQQEINSIIDQGIEEKMIEESKYKAMYEALGNASEECRKIIQLTFFKKLKDREIAPLMDYSELFVRTKRKRCLDGLKKTLGVG